MRVSITLLGCFAIGLLLSFFSLLPQWFLSFDMEGISTWLLYILLFFVGISIGVDESVIKIIKEMPRRSLIAPVLTIAGSLAATVLAFYILRSAGLVQSCGLSLRHSLGVNSALGYYSLSGILLTEAWGAQIGSIALLANLLRELLTILFGPLIRKWFGNYALVSCGGVTVTDTTMPIILRSCGNEAFALTMYCGIVTNIVVPFLLAFIVSI